MLRKTTAPLVGDAKASGRLWRVLALLAVVSFINYVDRGNLSVAAPLLKDELGMSASRLGVLLSSFFWTYALFQLVSGWLVNRFNVNWVMATGFLVWSGATAATGLRLAELLPSRKRRSTRPVASRSGGRGPM